MRPLRVLHLISGLGTGGAEMMLMKLLARTRLDASVVSMTDAGTLGDRIRECGAGLRLLNMTSGVPDPRGLWRLNAALREHRPDVLQTWMYHADLLGGVVGEWMNGIPVVWNIRQSDLTPASVKRSTRWTARTTARLSHWLPTRIVSCSHTAAVVHARLGYPEDKITVIPNGFDLATFRPDPEARAEVREELRIPQEAPVVGLVARRDPQKDHRNFFAAAALLRRNHPDVRFVLCGTGVTCMETQIDGWMRASGLPVECVRLLGERRDVPRITAALDVATSSSYGEGFPNAVGEAMSCAVPVVATDVGDSATLVDKCGVVVRPRDPTALAEGLHQLLTMSPPQRAAVGVAGRKRIAEHFSLDAITSRYDSLHEEVAANGTARQAITAVL